MEINNEILEIFKEFKILPDDGICYLVSTFHGYNPSYIPEEFKKKINATNIFIEKQGSIHWNIPLYDNQITGFEWVKTEYVKMFKNANSEKGGHVKESVIRLKRLFSKNPEIRKEDVIEAVRLYINNTDSKYIRFPHYFIEKGVGGDKTYDIINWIDKYQSIKESKNRNSVTNIMQ